MLCEGKYGFYISFNGINHKLLEGMTEKTITIEDAVQCITNEKQSKILKKIGKYSILNGKFGLCILCDSKFYSLPNGIDINALCEETCKEIVSQNKKSGKKRGK
jgi:topoisomerase IA-like protein